MGWWNQVRAQPGLMKVAIIVLMFATFAGGYVYLHFPHGTHERDLTEFVWLLSMMFYVFTFAFSRDRNRRPDQNTL
ncbi:MAG: hypothetical protein ACRYFW_09775 [Janthinobacterium lividum]